MRVAFQTPEQLMSSSFLLCHFLQSESDTAKENSLQDRKCFSSSTEEQGPEGHPENQRSAQELHLAEHRAGDPGHQVRLR